MTAFAEEPNTPLKTSVLAADAAHHAASVEFRY